MQVGSLKDAVTSGGFWMAWLLLVAGGLVGSPTASFVLVFVSVTCAVLPLAFGTTRQRISAGVAMLLGILLAVSLVDQAGNDPYLKKHRGQTIPVDGRTPVVR